MTRFGAYDKIEMYNTSVFHKNSTFTRGLNSRLSIVVKNTKAVSYIYILKKLVVFNSLLYRLFFFFLFLSNKKHPQLDRIDAYVLNLNFKKNRFFPQLKDTFFKKTVFNNSLGIISKYFSLRKSYLRGKSSYLLTAAYLRRLLLNINILKLRLEITKVPKYLKDIIRVLLTSANVFYKNPFNNSIIVNERATPTSFIFSYVFFTNNKSWGVIKRKKRGRLKRKISKKIILLNNVLD